MTSQPAQPPSTRSEWAYEDVQEGHMTADVDLDFPDTRDIARETVKLEATPFPESANPIIAAFQTNNMVQRIASGLLLGGAVTVYLCLGPAAAPIYLCSMVVAVCNYEYAWLSHRIAHRFTAAYAFRYHGEAAADSLPLDVHSVAASRLPCGSRHPKLAAGAAAFLITGIVTGIFLIFQNRYFHYQTVQYVNIYQKTLVYTWLDFILLISISTWITIFSALMTPTLTAAINAIMQQFVYSWAVLNFFTCFLYDTNCFNVMSSGPGRMNVVIFVLMNRVAWWRSVTPLHAINSVLHVMLDCIGFAYISMLISPMSALLMQVDQGARIALGFLAVVWGVDTGAYFCGHLLSSLRFKHSHFLARHISPNKDIEGSIGGIIVGLAATLLVDALWSQESGIAVDDKVKKQNQYRQIWRIIFAIVGGAISRYGDLFASLLKRLAGVKDTGTLIPGHGGLLDRVDAMLFLGAVFVLYHRIAFPGGYDSDISNTLLTYLNIQNKVLRAQSGSGAT
ncbi:hypothetical protein AC1031_017556 [Aphanomyces cochlioides]|nr:hypothetical protein AC1031_017556 [Aphanomyces cochlioides]